MMRRWLAALMAAAGVLIPSSAWAFEDAGTVSYRLDAKKAWDSSSTTWVRDHVQRVLAYPTTGDRYPAAGIPTLAYHDAWTMWGSGGLTPTHIGEYAAMVKRDREHGYLGQFMDDVNFQGGNVAGTRHQYVELIQAVRNAVGTGVVEINAQFWNIWPLIKSGEPEVAKALLLVDQVDKEFGIQANSGINSPTAYAEYLEYADTLANKGVHIDQSSTEPGDEYSLATYLLFNDGGDFVGTVLPGETYWSGFEVKLGAALGPRARESGLWVRHFTGGEAAAVEPGGGTHTIVFGSKRVTLSERQGAVLVGPTSGDTAADERYEAASAASVNASAVAARAIREAQTAVAGS